MIAPGQPRAGGSTSHSRQVRITTSVYLLYTYVYIHPRFPSLSTLNVRFSYLSDGGPRDFEVGQLVPTLSQVRKPSASPFFHNVASCEHLGLDTISMFASLQVCSIFWFCVLYDCFTRLFYWGCADRRFINRSKMHRLRDRLILDVETNCCYFCIQR